MKNLQTFDEIIKKVDEFRHQIEALKRDNVEFDDITTDEGLRKFLEKHSILINSTPAKKLVFTVNDLAEMFHVTTRTIYNWKEQGRINFVQISSKTYVTAVQLEDFLKQNEVNSLKIRRRNIL